MRLIIPQKNDIWENAFYRIFKIKDIINNRIYRTPDDEVFSYLDIDCSKFYKVALVWNWRLIKR